MASAHVLDNPCWYALTSHHAHLATGTSLAKRYPTDMVGAVAFANHNEAAFADLEQITGAAETVGFLEVNPPASIPGFKIGGTFVADQMVCEQDVPEPVAADDIVTLTADDVPDMLALIAIAQPGPFLARTIELGQYFGIRRDGKLVAMAGERFRLQGYSEISAVCTHPDEQGKGFARRLCSLLIRDNWKNGVVPFLHVNPANTTAVRLYESLHFTKRADMQVIVISRE